MEKNSRPITIAGIMRPNEATSPRGNPAGSRLSLIDIINLAAESIMVGFSLYVALVALGLSASFENLRVLLGQGEIIRICSGLAFCYAFVIVLRRGFRWKDIPAFSAALKKLGQFALEAHVIFLALLFLARGVNFLAIKLAVGMSLIISGTLLYLNLRARRYYVVNARTGIPGRKITLKKPALHGIGSESRIGDYIRSGGAVSNLQNDAAGPRVGRDLIEKSSG